jgi:hypothetical protein
LGRMTSLANLETDSPMSVSVSERWVIGVGGTSVMSSASRRAAVLERHRILRLLALHSPLL